MNKDQIVESLTNNYSDFIKYIQDLSQEDFLFSYQKKWTAGQQLNHLRLCVIPLVKIFGMPPSYIEQKFGRVNRPGRTYEELAKMYKIKTKGGGISPTQFLPEAIHFDQRDMLCEALMKLIQELCSEIKDFSDHDLDSLLIPHPILENLTLREMLYNTIDHVGHHQHLAQQYLSRKSQA
jgi:hypothetical protein